MAKLPWGEGGLVQNLSLFGILLIFVALSASQYNGSSEVSAGDLNFPTVEDLVNYTSEFQPLVAKLPPALVEERLQDLDTESSKYYYA